MNFFNSNLTKTVKHKKFSTRLQINAAWLLQQCGGDGVGW
jgi:hypothetical protein